MRRFHDEVDVSPFATSTEQETEDLFDDEIDTSMLDRDVNSEYWVVGCNSV